MVRQETRYRENACLSGSSVVRLRKIEGLPSEFRGRVGQLHNERETRLREALWCLRDEEKEVFLLRQNGDMTYEEIGEALNVPTGTVKTRMRLALQRLREALGHD